MDSLPRGQQLLIAKAETDTRRHLVRDVGQTRERRREKAREDKCSGLLRSVAMSLHPL